MNADGAISFFELQKLWNEVAVSGDISSRFAWDIGAMPGEVTCG